MSSRTTTGDAFATRTQSARCSSERRGSVAVLATALLIALPLLSGCNTFGGVGKDIESAGDAIADTNESTKD